MFYHIECMTVNGAPAQAIWAHATLNEALSAMHYTLYYQMNNENCSQCMVMVIDEHGAVYRSEEYIKPSEETDGE